MSLFVLLFAQRWPAATLSLASTTLLPPPMRILFSHFSQVLAAWQSPAAPRSPSSPSLRKGCRSARRKGGKCRSIMVYLFKFCHALCCFSAASLRSFRLSALSAAATLISLCSIRTLASARFIRVRNSVSRCSSRSHPRGAPSGCVRRLQLRQRQRLSCIVRPVWTQGYGFNRKLSISLYLEQEQEKQRRSD